MSTSTDTETLTEPDSAKSPETLEREIDQQRNSINHIVDSLEKRFTPGQLFDQAMAYTRSNGGEFFQNLGNVVKNNPMPVVLAGIGLAWLAASDKTPPAPARASAGPGLGSKLSHALGQATDTLAHATSNAASTGQGLKEHAGELSQQAQAQAAQLKNQFSRVLEEQPLVVAAVGLALGAALGAVLPTTRQESQLMGSTSNALTDTLKAKGEQAYAQVKEAIAQPAPGSEKDTQPPAEETYPRTAPLDNNVPAVPRL